MNLTNFLKQIDAITAQYSAGQLALYLLYLYEGSWNDKGITAMAGAVKAAMGFSAEEYQKARNKKIAVLGEVQESLGQTGAKQRLMTSYKDKYSGG